MNKNILISHTTLNDDFNEYLENIDKHDLVDMHISTAINYLHVIPNWIELPVMDADYCSTFTVGELISTLKEVKDQSGDINISELYICNLVQYINFNFHLS